jgi:peroxiredoxin
VAKHELTYTLYSDKTAAAARAFGIAFHVDEKTIETYEHYGIDLAAASGESHYQLPVPSVFIYNDGKMTFQYVNPDYKIRAPAEVILAAARSSR